MNCNGASAIILIYLMTVLPLFVDRNCKFIVYGTSEPQPGGINLFSRFADRLNATSNYAKSAFDIRTSGTLNSIYDLAGKILSEELEHEREQGRASESQNGNYSDKSGDGADAFSCLGVLPTAVASSTITNTTAYAAKKNELELINGRPVVVSNAGQSGHRQARKIQKASHTLHSRPFDQPKKSCLTTRIEKLASSRPSLPLLSMPVGRESGEKWKLSPISTQSLRERRQYATMEQEAPGCEWKGSRGSPVVGSNRIMNGSVESTVHGAGSESGEVDDDDDSSNRYWSPSVKWHRKLQIDGRKNYLPNYTASMANFLEKQSNRLIKSVEDMNQEDYNHHQGNRAVNSMNDFRSHISARSVESFPEVFSQPQVESNSMPIIGSGNGLNEAIKHANSLLSSVENVAGRTSSNPAGVIPDVPSQRVGKQIQGLDVVSFGGPKTEATIGGDVTTANLTNVMEKVLSELESLRDSKSTGDVPPEGSPCDVAGSWNSETIGLQFHISMANPSPSSRTFVEGKRIEIDLTERVPPRKHDLMDCDWFLTGSTTKQVGGPFTMTAQKADKYFVATFAGLCKTCGGIPTIFGSWTFVYSAKDCQDISLAVENKRDVLRKDTLEAKRKHRWDKLNSKDSGKCSKCSI